MKKFLMVIVASLIALLPFNANAASQINFTCGSKNSEGYRTCTVGYDIDSANPQDNVVVNLTEAGGAEVTAIEGVAGADFSVSSKNESNNVWAVLLVSPSKVSGEHQLFTFTYKDSGTPGCKVTISIGEQQKEVTSTDTPTENVQTGSTLPYIALGTLAVIAGIAYITTKNKAKMYKI